VRNTQLYVFKNGVLVIKNSDPDITAAGRVGITISGPTAGNITVKDFIGGDIRKTRFYLPSTGAAAISPAFDLDVAWSSSADADRLKCVTTRISSAMASKTEDAPGTSGDQKWLLRQYVSDQLSASSTIFGLVFGQIRASESNVDDNIDSITFKMLVVKPDATFRGRLLAINEYGTIAELSTSLRNKIIAQDTASNEIVTPLAVTAGDRIVIELGLSNSAVGASITGSLSFGDDSATDLTELDETVTAANNPWVELVGVSLTFGVSTANRRNLSHLGTRIGSRQAQ